MNKLKIAISREELYEEYVVKKKSISEIAKEKGCSEWVILDRLRRYGIKTRSRSEAQKLRKKKHPNQFTKEEEEILRKYYATAPKELLLSLLPNRSWESIKVKASKMGLKRGQPPRYFFDPEAVDKKDLGYLLGALMGDGWVSFINRKNREVNEVQIGIVAKEADYPFIESVYNTIKRMGFNCYITKRKRKKTYTYGVIFYSHSFGKWFKSLTKDDIKRMLDDDQVFFAFVRGFYEAEGSICRPKKETRKRHGAGWRSGVQVRIYNTEKWILDLIADGLNKRGIKAKVYKVYKRGGNRKDLWAVVISGVRHVEKFMEVVNPVIKNEPWKEN